MKHLSTITAFVLVTFVASTSKVQAAEDLTKIKLSCNSSSVAKTVGEAVSRDLRRNLQGLGTSFSDRQSAQVKVKYKVTQKAPRLNDANVSDYTNQGLSASSPSLGGTPPEGENGVINFSINASSVGSGAVLGRTCSESYKFTFTASMRITNQQTGKRIRYAGSVTTASTAVAGFYQSSK